MKDFLKVFGIVLMLAMAVGCSDIDEQAAIQNDKAVARIEGYAAAVRLRDEYVDEKDLPEDFSHEQYPRIVIDGVKMTYDPTFPEPYSKARGAYLSDTFGCEMMWLGLGKDLQLSDSNDFRDSDQSKYGKRDGVYIQNIDGDNLVIHRTGQLQIMDGGKWRDVKPGDELRPAAVEMLIGKDSSSPTRIGTSDLWARFLIIGNKWVICEPPNNPAGY